MKGQNPAKSNNSANDSPSGNAQAGTNHDAVLGSGTAPVSGSTVANVTGKSVATADDDDPFDDIDNPPPKKRPWFRWLIILVVLGGIGWGGYYAYTQMTTPPKESRRRSRTIEVKRVDLPIIVTANGSIQPEQSINVSPKTSGRLKQLLVKEGDRVRQDQVLAYMDDVNLMGQITQSEGQVLSAQANLDRLLAGNRPQDIGQAQANLENARATLQQSEIILQQNSALYRDGAISQRDYETARTNVEANRARVAQASQALSLQQAGSRVEDIEQARAQLLTAQGSLQSIQIQVEDTVIRAPFAGIVARKYADPGAFVTPTTSGSAVSSATASSILALATGNIVVANVAETNISQIKVGQTVEFQADAFPNRKFRGRVISISPQSIVQQNVTSFEVKAEITDKDKDLLRSGMNVSVEFKAGELKQVLVVPTVAIVRQQGGTGVFVRGAEGEAPVFTPIETGLTVNDRTEVRSGLKGDERIYVSFPEGQRPRTNIPGGGIPGMSPQRGGGSRG